MTTELRETGAVVVGEVAVVGTPDDCRGSCVNSTSAVSWSRSFDSPVNEAVDLVRWANDLQVQIDIVPRLFATIDPRAQIHTVEGFPLIGVPPARLWRSSLSLKRALDVAFAFLGLVLPSPLFLLIALRIRLESNGSVFYRHERVGLRGRSFLLNKFRTMHIEHCVGEGYGGAGAQEELARLLEDPEARVEFERSQKLADDPRVTRFGRFLRRTSLDELPQRPERRAGGHEPRRSAPGDSHRALALRRRDGAATDLPPRSHGLLADQWTLPDRIRRARPPRPRLRSRLVAEAGSHDSRKNRVGARQGARSVLTTAPRRVPEGSLRASQRPTRASTNRESAQPASCSARDG